MVMLDLRTQAADTVPYADAVSLSDEDRARAIATWKGRMVNEHVSARVFAALIPQLMKAGLDPAWQEQVAVMIQDELRHARLCATMVHALGGEAVAELPPLPAVPEHPDVPPLEGVLRNILSICCLSETVAVALIRAEHDTVSPESMQKTLSSILGDEVQHARFGWECFRALAPSMDDALKERLSDYLVVAFKHVREHELHYLPLGTTPSTEAESVGVCDGVEARRLFFDAVNEVISPGLESCGLNAQQAWDTSYGPLN
jgi:hypothetical protein